MMITRMIILEEKKYIKMVAYKQMMTTEQEGEKTEKKENIQIYKCKIYFEIGLFEEAVRFSA